MASLGIAMGTWLRKAYSCERGERMVAVLQAIFFDLYETLITEFDPDWTPSPSTAEQLGVDAGLFEREWRARHAQPMAGVYPDFASVLRDICHAIGPPTDDAVIRSLEAQRLALKAAPFASVDGAVLEALHDIRRMGVRIGVISNCAPEEVAAWSTSALPACCDDAVFSCQVGCAKPGADIYRLACRRLGVAPNDAVFVGDGGSDELDGAAGVGMAAYQATWFLNRWPAWRRAGPIYERASAYPRLRAPADLRALVAAQRRSDGSGAPH